MTIVHIVVRGRPLCGFSDQTPVHWADNEKAVTPEEAHYSNCFACVSKLHEIDEENIHQCH